MRTPVSFTCIMMPGQPQFVAAPARLPSRNRFTLSLSRTSQRSDSAVCQGVNDSMESQPGTVRNASIRLPPMVKEIISLVVVLLTHNATIATHNSNDNADMILNKRRSTTTLYSVGVISKSCGRRRQLKRPFFRRRRTRCRRSAPVASRFRSVSASLSLLSERA